MSEIDNKLGFCMHKLDAEIKKWMDADMQAAGYDEVTLTHGWILKYLYDNRDRDTYQRDIEKHFSIGRSTVTTIIQLMEKRNLVRRESVECDARLKKVVLTEKGLQHHDHVVGNFNKIHEAVYGSLTQEEKEFMLRIMDKLSEKIEGGKNVKDAFKTGKGV